MVIWFAALVLVTGQGNTPQKSLLQQIVPQPTGQNGYEDYLRACDAIGDRSVISDYMSWNPNPRTYVLGKEDPPPEMSPLARRLEKMSMLEVRREAVAKYAPVLRYLQRGNAKKVWEPREKIGALTTFPEYSYMKSVAKLADFAAYVAFADGRTREGTQYLIDEFILGQNLEGGILISHLVGIAIEAIAFSGFERHLSGLSRNDAEMIEKAVPGLLSGTPRLVDSLKQEYKMILQGLQEFLDNPEVGVDEEGDSMWPPKEIVSALKALSPERRQALYRQTEVLLLAKMEPLYKKFDGPESLWDDTKGDEEGEVKPPQRVEELPRYWAAEMTPVFNQSGIASARMRTQIRLLGLHAAVIRYMWDHNKLPKTLEDAVKKDRIEDPLSGQRFIYEPQGAWAFRIYSPGSKGTGEIGLRYRKAMGQGGDDGGVVPPR